MSLCVTSVEVIGDHRLRLTFNDDAVTEADFSGAFKGPLGEPLRDPAYFRQVRVDDEARTVVWPNGLDPDPYILHGDYEGAPLLTVRRIAGHLPRRTAARDRANPRPRGTRRRHLTAS